MNVHMLKVLTSNLLLGEEFKALKVKSSRRAAEDRARCRCKPCKYWRQQPAGMGNEAASRCWFWPVLLLVSFQLNDTTWIDMMLACKNGRNIP